MVQALLRCCLLLIGLAMTGCSSSTLERVAARGAVQFDGRPLAAGKITFLPIDGTKGPAAVATITDGFYEFDRATGPVIGRHRVEIEALVDPGFPLDDEAAYARAAAKTTAGKPVLPPETIPAVYNRQSNLQATIERGGDQKFDFLLDRPANDARR